MNKKEKSKLAEEEDSEEKEGERNDNWTK